jgi:hypothetical protein
MNGYLQSIIYDTYAREHHSNLIEVCDNCRLTHEDKKLPEGNQPAKRRILHNKLRMAYFLALIFLATLLITQVVIAAINSSGGHGAYLVR